MSYSRIDLIILFTAAEWAASDLILHTYEAGMERDTGKMKQGNGLDLFSALSYLPGFGGGGGTGDMTKAVYDPSNISADAFDRANHTGTQLAATISDFVTAVNAAEVDPVFGAWLAGPPNVSEFTNDAGYITSETPQDFNSVLGAGNTTGGEDIVVSSGDTLTVPKTGLKILDTDASHSLTVSYETDLSANRILSIFTGDADRALTIAGTASISGTNTGDNATNTQYSGLAALIKYKVIAKSGATVSSTNTASEEILASVLIPSGTLGNNDAIRVWALFNCAAGAGNRIFRIRLHTSAAAGGTVYQQATLGSGGGGFKALADIQMKNANNSQEGFGQLNNAFSTGNVVITSALSTGSDMYIVITSQKATGTDSGDLRNYTVEIVTP